MDSKQTANSSARMNANILIIFISWFCLFNVFGMLPIKCPEPRF